MLCRDREEDIYRMVYDSGYLFWVDIQAQKRMFRSAVDVKTEIDTMEVAARKYRQYINGLVLGDDSAPAYTRTILHRHPR